MAWFNLSTGMVIRVGVFSIFAHFNSVHINLFFEKFSNESLYLPFLSIYTSLHMKNLVFGEAPLEVIFAILLVTPIVSIVRLLFS